MYRTISLALEKGKYSRISRKRPPRKFEEVVVTRAGRFRECGQGKKEKKGNFLSFSPQSPLLFFLPPFFLSYPPHSPLTPATQATMQAKRMTEIQYRTVKDLNRPFVQCAASLKCWFIWIRLEVVAYESLKTKIKSIWVITWSLFLTRALSHSSIGLSERWS